MRARAYRPPARGISLIEALIAGLILSAGLIGLMRMQSQLVSASTDAQLRYSAVQLADELLNVVRIDAANAACYTLPQSGACGSAAATTYTTDWSARTAASLPGTVTRTVALNAATGRMTVSIGWTSRNGADPRLLNVETDVRP